MEPLLVERNNQTGKIVNGFGVYNLDEQPKIGHINFTSKNCLFGVIPIVKNSDKRRMCIVTMDQHLMDEIHGFFVMTFL